MVESNRLLPDRTRIVTERTHQFYSERSLTARHLLWEQDQVGAAPTVPTNFNRYQPVFEALTNESRTSKIYLGRIMRTRGYGLATFLRIYATQ